MARLFDRRRAIVVVFEMFSRGFASRTTKSAPLRRPSNPRAKERAASIRTPRVEAARDAEVLGHLRRESIVDDGALKDVRPFEKLSEALPGESAAASLGCANAPPGRESASCEESTLDERST
jgi:hypothetical protein